METKNEKEVKINQEEKKSNKIEDTINDMLDKVMEEKDDPSNSLDFYDDELEDESFKISRHSTRHQTTAKSIANLSKNSNNMQQFFNLPNFDRVNKRNLTVNSNQVSTPSFNNSFYNSNFPLIRNPFTNNFAPNFFNNNSISNNIGFNNNLNQSFQSTHTFNPQYSNNFLNSSMAKNDFIRNSLPYSKTVVYHNNQGNIFNFGNNILQPNFFNLNNNNNIQMPFNRNNNAGYIPINFDFKRGENRKKTYDTPVNLQNNIINCINNNTNNMSNNNNNINNICFNKNIEGQLLKQFSNVCF